MADDKPVSRVRINLGNRDKPKPQTSEQPQSRVRINLTGRH